MEIRQQKKTGGRFRFLWLLLAVNVVLVAGIWQYHRLIVEVSDGAASDLYRSVLSPFGRGERLGGQSLRVAMLQSEATAHAFGEWRDGYYNLLSMWRQMMDREGFGYRTVTEVPRGADAEPFNLLLLPAASCLGHGDREAVKAFLRAGKGVLMTWATGTRDEYGQWVRYSLLHEVGGMEMTGAPPVSEDNIGTIMLSGGYPVTADLYPGLALNVTAYDQPITCHVREERTKVDGVWSDPGEPSYELHSVRDRAAVTHGTYMGGRFVWTGYTIGAGMNLPEQREAFHMLFKSAMLWAGHQVLAFKPVWPDDRMSVVSVTLNIHGPEDVDMRLLEMLRRYRVPVTSFVRAGALDEVPERMSALAAAGEIGLLGTPGADYEGRPAAVMRAEIEASRKRLRAASGMDPRGFRLPEGVAHGDAMLDALVRAGFAYVSSADFDRMVPRPMRRYRPVALLTRPRTLWKVPEMRYLGGGRLPPNVDNAMLAHFSQILALGGHYCLSFRPSAVDSGFVERLGTLVAAVKREPQVAFMTAGDVTAFWEGWDHIKVATRNLSPARTSLKISNTWFEPVGNVVVNVEMPHVLRRLDIESMTLGTELPESMSSSGVRWRLRFGRLGAGKHVVYYLNRGKEPPAPGAAPREGAEAVGEVW